MVTRPLWGDPWVNGAFDDGKDFQGPSNFFNGFPSFSQKFCISAITKHWQWDKKINWFISKNFKLQKKSIDIFGSSKRGLMIHSMNSAWNSFAWQLGPNNCRFLKDGAPCSSTNSTTTYTNSLQEPMAFLRFDAKVPPFPPSVRARCTNCNLLCCCCWPLAFGKNRRLLLCCLCLKNGRRQIRGTVWFRKRRRQAAGTHQ